MATDDLAERLQRIESALGWITTQVTELGELGEMRSQLDEMDARLARMEDALYPVDPASGWGPNGSPTVRGPR